MSVAVCGMGWVTPLGVEIDEVWQRLMAGEQGEIQPIKAPHGRTYFHMPVSLKSDNALAKSPRLRRSGKITYLTTAAGLAALEDARIKMSPEIAGRMALISAIASGGVVYTRKFYEPIAAQQTDLASPLLFPETVFNAPASHLAATLGIDGASYTLVGDAGVGITALKQAEQLIESEEVDYCLVVGGEEVDWVLCEAYGQWRLTSRQKHVRLHTRPARGAILAEGAAALVLARDGRVRLSQVHDGETFLRRSDAEAAMKRVLYDLTKNHLPDLLVGSANGTFIDAAEEAAVKACVNGAGLCFPKGALGEALGASALIQVIIAVLALERNEVPPAVNSQKIVSQFDRSQRLRSAVVSVLGFNQQATGLACEISQPV